MEWKDLLLALIVLISCTVCSALPTPNNDAMAMASDYANALSGFGEVVNTGAYSQTISGPGTFADGHSWSAGATADVLGTKVAFETGASSALALGIDPFGPNVAHAAGTHSSSAISSELGFSTANAQSNSRSMTMGTGQASSDAQASAITDNEFVLATGQASTKATVEGSGGFIIPPVIPNDQCKDGKCDFDQCKDRKCGEWPHSDEDKCHRHDRPHKPHNKPEPPVKPDSVVVEHITYYTEFVPIAFATMPQHAYINEVGQCVELYSVNVNMLLNGSKIVQKETGALLLAFNADDGLLVSGDHPVFSWDTSPTNGILMFVDESGKVLDEFRYITPADLINNSAQRVPDGSATIVTNLPTTWWEENSL